MTKNLKGPDVRRMSAVTVSVSANGVTIETATAIVGMSRFSNHAQRLTAGLGIGVHVFATPADVADVDYAGGCWADIMDALS